MSLLRRLWQYLNASPVIEAIAPEDPPVERERIRLRGLCEISRASRDNLIFLQAHPSFVARRAQKGK